MRWQTARVVSWMDETPTARTLRLDVAGWPGHLAGQHIDVRLTAEDGYQAQRSYSLAAPADAGGVEITVQVIEDGEVSPFLAHELQAGDLVEVRGPIGGWFIWRPGQAEPVLLVGGGSGIVPLMAMIRARAAAGSRAPFRLIYSVRRPVDVYYSRELAQRVRDDRGLDVTILYTRSAPEAVTRPPHRITADDLIAHGWPSDLQPQCYLCGPTPFVETVADLLVATGHDPQRIKAERFGATGG